MNHPSPSLLPPASTPGLLTPDLLLYLQISYLSQARIRPRPRTYVPTSVCVSITAHSPRSPFFRHLHCSRFPPFAHRTREQRIIDTWTRDSNHDKGGGDKCGLTGMDVARVAAVGEGENGERVRERKGTRSFSVQREDIYIHTYIHTYIHRILSR